MTTTVTEHGNVKTKQAHNCGNKLPHDTNFKTT